MEQIVHVENGRKFTFYVNEGVLVGAVFCNKLHLFDAPEFKPVYNCFESTDYKRLVDKCKRKFGVSEVIEHRSWRVALVKVDTKTINVESMVMAGDASHENTQELIKLFTE